MNKDFDIYCFYKILNNIKCVYFESLNNNKKFWQYAEYNFLYRALQENSENQNNDLHYDGYSYRIEYYFKEAIHARAECNEIMTLIKLKGKILTFDVYSTMFDCLGENETNGFIDSCDTPPPEFWIHFDGEKLYSFIPNELIETVNRAINISMSESLEWYTDLIEI